MQKNRQRQRGTTLIELLVATTILGVVMTAIVAIITLSVKNMADAKARSIAVKYGQEGMEVFRRQRDTLGWEAFLAALTTDGAAVGGATLSYCLPGIPDSAGFVALTGGVCQPSDETDFVDAKKVFQRQADIHLTSDAGRTQVNISLVVSWDDAGNTRQSRVSQRLEKNVN